MFFCCWPCQSSENLFEEGNNRLSKVGIAVFTFNDKTSDSAERKNFNQNARILIKALKLLKAAADKNHIQARAVFGKNVQVKNEPLAKLICKVFKDSLESQQGSFVEQARLLGNRYSVV